MSDMSDTKKKLILKVGAGVVAIVVPVTAYFEGTVLRTYRDPIGVITSCRGHTGPELKMGQTFTKEQCDEQQFGDLLAHASDLDCVKKPMTDGQKAAFLSFSYNVGRRAFCSSTLARKANAGDMAGACAELSRWTMAGGEELPGLVARRSVERAICEGRAP